MSELLLVNPRRRKRKAARRNPKRRTMTAKQAKYFGGGKTARRKSKRRSTARAAASPVARRSHRKARRSRRSFMRNTSGSLSLKPNVFIKETLIPSAIGGAGALLVDVAWGALPFIPASVKTGPLAPFVKAAGAVAVGLVASKVAGKKIGAQVTGGYLTVLAYNLLKGVVQKAMPQLPMGDYNMGYVQAGAFLPDQSISAYLEAPTPSQSGVGAYLNGYDNNYSNDTYHG